MEPPEQRGVLVSLDSRTRGEQTGLAVWGWDVDKSPPGRDSDGKRPLEAGQPHLVGIGSDSRFQTWLQPFTLPWARAALSVDTGCKASHQPAHGRAWGDCPGLSMPCHNQAPQKAWDIFLGGEHSQGIFSRHPPCNRTVCAHFTVEKSKAQKGKKLYPRLIASKWGNWDRSPGFRSPEPFLLDGEFQGGRCDATSPAWLL